MYWDYSYVFLSDTVEYRLMRDSPAGDAAYFGEAVGDRLYRSGFVARTRTCGEGSPRAFTRVCFTFHLLHSMLRVR